MTATTGKQTGAPRTLAVRMLKLALAAWVLASLLFAHGCHRHEDNELFTNLIKFSARVAPRER